MPAKTPLLRPLQSLYAYAFSEHFICSSCLIKQRYNAVTAVRQSWKARARIHPQHSRRHASSITPVTAINATKTIPLSNRKLYEKLIALEKNAAGYINISQLQLALRGLESEEPVIRIAVLGLDGQRGVRKLVRAVLADPLSAEETWERQLLSEADNDSRALLLRFGEDYHYDQRHPLLHTLSFPSTILNKHKIEILVYNIDTGQQNGEGSAQIVSQDLLVPALETPTSASGRVSMVTYPVHKVLVYGENVRGILSIPHATYQENTETRNALIKGVINVEWHSTDQESSDKELLTLINLSQAEKAITSMRASIENAFDYEHKWLASNISELTTFLLPNPSPDSPPTLNTAIKSLISAILTNATNAITSSETSRATSLAASTVSESTRTALSSALTHWAEAAHIELRDQLALAFTSRAWHKLAWWKLLWRIDDVGFIAADVLQRAFLIGAEKEITFIGGRILQARLLQPSPTPTNAAPEEHKLGADPPAPSLRDVLPAPDILGPTASQADTAMALTRPDPSNPQPQAIGLTRAALLATVPSLQALAQTLLLQSLSTTAVTTALSALVYLSLSTTSLYEAGAIGLLGFVWSARRLQRRWESAREAWVAQVREEGRKVLGLVEGRCRRVVRDGGRSSIGEGMVEEVGSAEEMVARAAVAEAREVLEER